MLTHAARAAAKQLNKHRHLWWPRAARAKGSGQSNTRPRDTFWDMNEPPEENSVKRLTAQSAIRMINQYNIGTTIYTDGSCKGGTEDGGAAAVITTGTAANPVVIETIKKKGSKFTCSYDEEKAALMEALKWMEVNQKYDDTIICSSHHMFFSPSLRPGYCSSPYLQSWFPQRCQHYLYPHFPVLLTSHLPSVLATVPHPTSSPGSHNGVNTTYTPTSLSWLEA